MVKFPVFAYIGATLASHCFPTDDFSTVLLAELTDLTEFLSGVCHTI